MRILPRKIMCAVDFSSSTEKLVEYSASLCKEFHASLVLVHIVLDVDTLLISSESFIDLKEIQRLHIKGARERLDLLAKELTIKAELLVGQGAPADEIARLALEKEIDMVTMATHGKSGIKRFMIGSVTEKVMKTINCPLLVLSARESDSLSPANIPMKLEKVLVGCDFSPDSKLAFAYGLSLAQEFQAQLFLVHVIKPTEYDEKREKIDELRGRLESQLHWMVPEESRNWCTPNIALLDGEPCRELMKYAKEQEIDMIVLGIRGHTLLEKLFVGSTADRVIRQSPCPVLAVRQM